MRRLLEPSVVEKEKSHARIQGGSRDLEEHSISSVMEVKRMHEEILDELGIRHKKLIKYW